MLKLLLTLAFALVLLQGDVLILNWSYPFNDSTYRTYQSHLARIVYISELGEDGFNDFEGDTTLITLYGDADEADIHIRRLHPTCWRLSIETNYPLMDHVQRDFVTCYEKQLALVMR